MNRLTFIQIQERIRSMRLEIATGREQMTTDQRQAIADELTPLLQLVQPEESPVAEGELSIEAAQRSMGGQDAAATR